MIMVLVRLLCVMYGRSACYCRGARGLHTLQDLKCQIMNDEQSALRRGWWVAQLHCKFGTPAVAEFPFTPGSYWQCSACVVCDLCSGRSRFVSILAYVSALINPQVNIVRDSVMFVFIFNSWCPHVFIFLMCSGNSWHTNVSFFFIAQDRGVVGSLFCLCLLYTSDAADE